MNVPETWICITLCSGLACCALLCDLLLWSWPPFRRKASIKQISQLSIFFNRNTLLWVHCFEGCSIALGQPALKNPLKPSCRYLGIKCIIWEGNNTFTNLCQPRGDSSLLHFMSWDDDHNKNWLKSHRPCFCLQIGLSSYTNQVLEPFMFLGWIPAWVHLWWNCSSSLTNLVILKQPFWENTTLTARKGKVITADFRQKL